MRNKDYPIYSDATRSYMEGDTDASEFHSFLKEIVDAEEYNDETERGILRRVIGGGDTGKLSSKQAFILQTIVQRYPEHCSFCGNEISWSERRYAQVNKNRCSGCVHNLTSDHT